MTEKNFAQLFEESFAAPTHYEPGAKVEAEVVSVGREYVFIDLGGKSEGYFAVSEVMDESGEVTVAAGDTVVAYFLSAGKGGMLFTTMRGTGAGAHAHLEDAWRSGVPVEGTVDGEVKGGFSIKLTGQVRAFCPFSQMGVARRENDEVLGTKLPFVIIECKDNGRSVVVSHRKAREIERRARRDELRRTLAAGDRVRGTVVSLRNFGAFVDIGGLEGLLPVSEVAWSRVESIEDVLHVGQELDLVVLALDWENDRFSFSRKQAMRDPWERAAEDFPVGTPVTGTVARLVNFGAFVTLADGVDGLIHVSKLGGGRRINHPREVVAVGDRVEVKIEAFDLERRRVSLSMADGAAARQEDGGGSERREYECFRARQGASDRAPASLGTLGDLLADKLRRV